MPLNNASSDAIAFQLKYVWPFGLNGILVGFVRGGAVIFNALVI